MPRNPQRCRQRGWGGRNVSQPLVTVPDAFGHKRTSLSHTLSLTLILSLSLSRPPISLSPAHLSLSLSLSPLTHSGARARCPHGAPPEQLWRPRPRIRGRRVQRLGRRRLGRSGLRDAGVHPRSERPCSIRRGQQPAALGLGRRGQYGAVTDEEPVRRQQVMTCPSKKQKIGWPANRMARPPDASPIDLWLRTGGKSLYSAAVPQPPPTYQARRIIGGSNPNFSTLVPSPP